MNIFEGARRMAMLTGGLIAAGFLFVFAFFENPPAPISVNYQVADVGQPPMRVHECPVDATYATKFDSKHNRSVEVWICAPHSRATVEQLHSALRKLPSEKLEWELLTELKKRSLIPAKLERGDAPSDREELEFFRRLEQERVESFTIPEADEGYITRLGWMQTLKQAGQYLLGLMASLAGFWAFTWAVGWIVRGFMGIPRGSDQKPQP